MVGISSKPKFSYFFVNKIYVSCCYIAKLFKILYKQDLVLFLKIKNFINKNFFWFSESSRLSIRYQKFCYICRNFFLIVRPTPDSNFLLNKCLKV